ncbi:hypothetical protein Clacol_005736 [Clathrus columnatus]|uniref:Ubinuclein middle domain-containing protein n=1 Tax=Clathrus columnatus TaxID=1419009 RepID=A0AAV5AFR7_9AGAM|nr:hypothetical protein Clacol_005736 [Clathrus columnatus]
MSVDSLRLQQPPSSHSSPSNPRRTLTRSPSASPTNDEEGQEQFIDVDGGQLGSAPPPDTPQESPTNNPPAAPLSSVQQSKPKSVKHRKSRSPSPLPVVHPPPLQTIRLDIKLGGPDNYEVDITALALDAGQRPPTPLLPLPKPDSSDSEEDSDHHPPSKTPPPQEKKGKKKASFRTNPGLPAKYDLTDPFIDDSDLGIDDRTHFPQTKQKGFYVSSGEVALLVPENAATANIQPLSQTVSRPRTPQPQPQSQPPPTIKPPDGTADSPIPLVEDDEHKQSQSLKRNRSASPPVTDAPLDSDAGRKRTKKARPPASTEVSTTAVSAPPSRSHRNASSHRFSDELEASFDALKIAIAEENWEVKGKFPPTMKPKLQQLALQAIIQGEYNEHFFARMPLIFPYNKFTMTKLIKRLVYNDHHKLLITRQDELLAELKVLADTGFEQAKLEWEKNVQNWKDRTAKGSAAPDSTNQPDDTMDDHDDPDKETKEGVGANSSSARDAKDKEPPKKYRLTEKMNQLEGIPDVVSEQGMRKGLYQKIIAAFPEGWMTSGNISRDISVIKKKHETEQNRYDDYS